MLSDLSSNNPVGLGQTLGMVARVLRGPPRDLVLWLRHGWTFLPSG